MTMKEHKEKDFIELTRLEASQSSLQWDQLALKSKALQEN